MKLQHELEPILGQIRSKAEQKWREYIQSRMRTGQATEPDAPNAVDPNAQKETNEFFGSVDDLLNRLRRYYVLDAHDFKVNVDQLADASGGGGPNARPIGGTVDGSVFAAEEDVRPVANMINEGLWLGDAATNFEKNFLAPFDRASKCQRFYAREMATAAAAFQVASSRSGRSVTFVAQSCLAALDGISKSKAELGFADTSKDMPGKAVVEAVGIVLGVIGLFASGGTALIVGAAGLASGLYGVAKHGGTEPNLQILPLEPNSSPMNVIVSAENALKSLEEWIADQDGLLAAGLKADISSAQAFDSPELRVPKPRISAGTYKQLDLIERPGGKNQTVANLVELGKAGTHNLPTAAQQYSLSARYMDGCQVPGSLSTFFPRSIPLFNQAADELADILHETSRSLTDAGDAMVTAMQNYRVTDDERASINAQILAAGPTIAPTK
ncbi:hypothetical protein GCM10022225_08560 [Plantactinospora mayteni]|uniref:Uncharacterized protein n=1 Tax=Plantactinospora mayteni TaxID=566021 RepID=A0ABQ4EJM1_9ACTN|nr:hypothetical protein [Plantactinospora mayteni]GIG94397.1 hypothetical protein Pma05_09700 [Plantactinospora mayteni]